MKPWDVVGTLMYYLDEAVRQNGPMRWVLMLAGVALVAAIRYIALVSLGGTNFMVLALLLGTIIIIRIIITKFGFSGTASQADDRAPPSKQVYVRSKRGRLHAPSKMDDPLRIGKLSQLPSGKATTFLGKSPDGASTTRGAASACEDSQATADGDSRSTRHRLQDRQKHRAPYRGLTEAQRKRRKRFLERTRADEDCGTPRAAASSAALGEEHCGDLDRPSAPPQPLKSTGAESMHASLDELELIGSPRARASAAGRSRSQSSRSRSEPPVEVPLDTELAAFLGRAGTPACRAILQDEAVTMRLLIRCFRSRGEGGVRGLLRESGVSKAGQREAILMQLQDEQGEAGRPIGAATGEVQREAELGIGPD